MSNRKSSSKPRRHSSNPRAHADEVIWIFGLHSVRQALANKHRNNIQLVVSKNALAQLQETLERHAPTLPVETADPQALSKRLPQGAVHQGAALETYPLPEPNLDDILPQLKDDSMIVVLDQVTDPHNVGAILRSCAAFEVSALIMHKRHSPPETGTLAKSASGALDLIPTIRLPNLARGLDKLQQEGVTILGLDESADVYLDSALEALSTDQGPHLGPTAIVLGAEGVGLRALTRQKCNHLVRLPTSEQMPSLNVSNAAAVTLYALRKAQQK